MTKQRISTQCGVHEICSGNEFQSFVNVWVENITGCFCEPTHTTAASILKVIISRSSRPLQEGQFWQMLCLRNSGDHYNHTNIAIMEQNRGPRFELVTHITAPDNGKLPYQCPAHSNDSHCSGRIGAGPHAAGLKWHLIMAFFSKPKIHC